MSFYWCLIEFIDWGYSQSCWYFRPAFFVLASRSPLLPRGSAFTTCTNKVKARHRHRWDSNSWSPVAPPTLSLVSSPFPLPCSNKYTVHTYTMCKGGGGLGVWGHRRVGGLRLNIYLPQSPFTGQFFFITTFGIAFYQSNLSKLLSFRPVTEI